MCMGFLPAAAGTHAAKVNFHLFSIFPTVSDNCNFVGNVCEEMCDEFELWLHTQLIDSLGVGSISGLTLVQLTCCLRLAELITL